MQAQHPAPLCSTSSAALFAALGTLAGIDSLVRQHGAGPASPRPSASRNDNHNNDHGDQDYQAYQDDLAVLEVVVDEAAMQVCLHIHVSVTPDGTTPHRNGCQPLPTAHRSVRFAW